MPSESEYNLPDSKQKILFFDATKKSYKKFDFDQKAITSAEKNSSLTLEEAIARWVGLEAVKERFDSHNIKY